MTDKDHLPGFKAVCLDNSSSLAQLALIPGGGGRGGGGTQQMSPPRGPTPYAFTHHFS